MQVCTTGAHNGFCLCFLERPAKKEEAFREDRRKMDPAGGPPQRSNPVPRSGPGGRGHPAHPSPSNTSVPGSYGGSIWMMWRLADFCRLREKSRGLQGFLLLRALGLWLQMAWSEEEGLSVEEWWGLGLSDSSGGQQMSLGGMKKSGILSGVSTLA